MKTLLIRIFYLTTLFCGTANGKQVTPRVFYIDAISGKDSNTGHAVTAAWKTLDRVNAAVFYPGDQILFKSGQSWIGQLNPKGNGQLKKPILIGKYGYGKKPSIAGNGVANGTLYFHNQQYWEVSDLEITNYDAKEQQGQELSAWENGNHTTYVLPILPRQLVNKNKPKYGIYVTAEDVGEVSHLYFKNLEVHGVNGYINQADELSKENGGIVFKVLGSEKPTYFNGILIDSCHIHDVDRTGILLVSSPWSKRTLLTNTNWVPSLNIVLRRNKLSKTGANALVVRVAKNPIIEYNLFDRCAIKGSGNAGFSFNTDNALWQYNECRFTKANVDDRDAGGIDSDYKTKHTVLQYNYVHDNDYGMLVTGGPNNFNDSTIVRYNIFENDGKFAHPTHKKCVIRVSGSATNTQVYNNVIFLGADQIDTKVVSHEVWKTSPDGTVYRNNIFYNLSTNAYCDYEESTNNYFDTNLYFGNPIKNILFDANGIYRDPLFVNNQKGVQKYHLRLGSPAFGTGHIIKNNGGRDFYGNLVDRDKAPNIGVYNGALK
ncbi:right-handed parallel beta-helix repeat-containing protein [Pedobacter insulae]|uniref:right-handed parallel beta-helix repeat-containing protein n=1 Tax=Pedobacter insulae TaxID=414048 RepID=UPI0011608F01|nr:right-handed parallel beta-helix repeat-containing protein [Pedobacter insulae]